MRPVGRPQEIDADGVPIVKATINVHVPARLIEFLKTAKKGKPVNRSELFTKAATQLFQNKICSKCFSKDIEETSIGMRCKPCSRYAPFWYHLKRCTICDTQYKPGENLLKAIKGSDDWGCDRCQE